MPGEPRPPTVHYGGPDRPPRALRDLLKARIEASPPGSRITWAAYYFRDRDLARALVAAHKRDVSVRVVIDGRPRRPAVNAPVRQLLAEGLGDGFRERRSRIPGPRMHAKLYVFSGPRPSALVGSFNPSGDISEDPALLAEIGDQDRGHNLLVEYGDEAMVGALESRVLRLWAGCGLSRFSSLQNRSARSGPEAVYAFPRANPNVVERYLDGLSPGDRVQAAISHMDRTPFLRRLEQAARRGVEVQLVAHDTQRRVKDRVVRGIRAAGARIRRYVHPERLPMHAKFVLVERDGVRTAWFGSLNFNASSRYLNHEVLVRSTDPDLVASLERRFAVIQSEADRFCAA